MIKLPVLYEDEAAHLGLWEEFNLAHQQDLGARMFQRYSHDFGTRLLAMIMEEGKKTDFEKGKEPCSRGP